jgi:uncharacterized protein (TIGR02270 family)
MQVIPSIVEQHVEEAVCLRRTRRVLTGAPHVTLRDLGRHDNRIEAHLDALAIAGEEAWALCQAALESPSVGAVFTAAVRAVSEQQQTRFERLLALSETVPGSRAGLVSALGWLEPPKLRGTVSALLRSNGWYRRSVGVAACAAHRVDPGLASGRFIEDPARDVRARALRAAGELGRLELLSACLAAADDEDPECPFWAAWSAVLLGDRNRGLEAMTQASLEVDAHENIALFTCLATARMRDAHAVLQRLARQPHRLRSLIKGSGIAGDPAYIPWLIEHMRRDRTARLAGEAFAFITGADLPLLRLVRARPADHESGPNDDPDDPSVDMDEDEDLPWPDGGRVQVWWDTNSERFQAGTRYFMGEPPSRESCIRILEKGYQRQRIAAALHLSLLNPGTPLFEWRAPARRQQRLLAEMS